VTTLKDNGIKIEKGIPVPPPRGNQKSAFINQMQSGDSVLFLDYKAANNARGVIIRTGCTAVVRKEKGGWRVWKIAKEANVS
jgi:hypothetical protein